MVESSIYDVVFYDEKRTLETSEHIRHNITQPESSNRRKCEHLYMLYIHIKQAQRGETSVLMDCK